MITFVSLDTNYPPTWNGTPVTGIAPHTDAVTALRHIVGDDKLNYFNFQREQGDLFNRDLANFGNVKQLIDHLSTRGGLVFQSPQVSLRDGTHLPLGRFGGLAAEVPNYYLIALGAFLAAGGTNGSVGIRIVEEATPANVLASATGKDEIEWAVTAIAPTTNRGTVLDGSKLMEVQLYNESGSTLALLGFAVVRPKTS